ncbi:MAG: DMT family transporter, partial [Armatimonadetes bacterium]|nr:DMT family transporter [Armatimonadota bacterium]
MNLADDVRLLRRRRRQCLIMLIGGQAVIGSSALMVRVGLSAHIDPVTLSAWRLTLAGLAALALLPLSPYPESLRLAPGEWMRLLLAGGALAAHFALWIASLQYISVANSTLLVCTTPIWAGLLSWVVGKRPPERSFWFGMVGAAAGAILVTRSGAVHVSNQPARGATLALGGALLFALYLLLAAGLQPRLGVARLIAGTYSSAACWLWIVLLAHHAAPLVPYSESGWAAIIGMAALPQMVGHTSMNWSLKQLPAHGVAAATLLEPVFASVLAWLLLGEPLVVFQVLGG